MSGNRKGEIDTMMFLAIVVISVLLLAAITAGINWARVITLKGEISLAFTVEDKGTELLSLLKTTKGGNSNLKIISSAFAENVPADYEEVLLESFGNLENYYSEIKDAGGNTIKKYFPETTTRKKSLPLEGLELAFPTKSGDSSLRYFITSPYTGERPRTDVNRESTNPHKGVDFRIGKDGISKYIYPAADGEVTYVESSCPSDDLMNCEYTCDYSSYGCPFGSAQERNDYCNCGGHYGNRIIIEHGHGSKTYQTFYGHLDQILVNVGDSVTTETKIAVGGNSGWSTAPHLHFEVRYRNSPIDPCHYFEPEVVPLSSCTIADEVSARERIVDVMIPLPGGDTGEMEMRTW